MISSQSLQSRNELWTLNLALSINLFCDLEGHLVPTVIDIAKGVMDKYWNETSLAQLIWKTYLTFDKALITVAWRQFIIKKTCVIIMINYWSRRK